MQLTHKDHIVSKVNSNVYILASNLTSPYNVGAIFRLSDALGVTKIFLSGTTICPPNQKIRKTSRSTEKYIDFEYCENPLEILDGLRSEGVKIISLELTSGSKDIKNLKLEKDEKVCLIVGSENHGIAEELLEISDAIIHIPMLGNNSSMNVSVATGIAIYDIVSKIR